MRSGRNQADGVARGKLRNKVLAPPAWAEETQNPFLEDRADGAFLHRVFERAKTDRGVTRQEIYQIVPRPKSRDPWQYASENLNKGLRRPDKKGQFGHSGLIWDLWVGNFELSEGGTIKDAEPFSHSESIFVRKVRRSDGRHNSEVAVKASRPSEHAEEQPSHIPEPYTGLERSTLQPLPVSTVEDSFDPEDVREWRERVIREITQRRGQEAFRAGLLSAYECRCAFSGCQIEEVLEAAHISPYKGETTNVLTNGILLRADLHTLFDLGFISVNADDFCVEIGQHLLCS